MLIILGKLAYDIDEIGPLSGSTNPVMPDNSAFRQPTGPLNIGNVVSASLRLYRSHLKQYVSIALLASFWFALPFLILVPFALLDVFLSSLTEGVEIFLLMIWVVFGLYCWAKFLVNSALISRLVFQELLNQPETVKAARRNLKSRTWLFLLTQFLMGLIFIVINVCLFILQMLLFSLPAGILGTFLADDSGIASLITFLIGIVGYLLSTAISLWLTARFFIPEVPLAVENDAGSVEAIYRSWKLTKGFAWRVAIVITIAFLVTLPLYSIAIIPTIVTLASAAPFTPDTLFDEVAIALLISLLVGGLLLVLAGILTIPLWQSIKGVIYYDLRSRREGIDLETRDSSF